MNEPGRQYRSFLLRLWEAKVNGRIVWRCSLQEVGSGLYVDFATLDSMMAYLAAATAVPLLPQNPASGEESGEGSGGDRAGKPP